MNTVEINLVELPKTLEIHVADKQMHWQEAMDYAKSINMRLPTKLELQVIAASTDEFNLLGWCWSSSSRSTNSTDAWVVDLYDGDTFTDIETLALSVLCLSP